MEAAGRCARYCLMSGSVVEGFSTNVRVRCINRSRIDWRVEEPYSEAEQESLSGLTALRVSNARSRVRQVGHWTREVLARQCRVHNSCKEVLSGNGFDFA